MSRIRIYELAKELGLENKALIDLCEQIGLDGKRSHSSSLTDEEAEKIRRTVIRSAVGGPGSSSRDLQREGGVVTERRLGNVIRRRKKTEEEIQAEEQEKAIDLTSVQPRGIEFPSLTPNLENERQSREAALARANALFEPRRPDEDDDKSEPAPAFEQPVRVLAESQTAASEAPVQPAEEVLPADEPEEEAATGGQVVQLDEARRRHDIRAPKILGKIDLPRAEPARREQPRRNGAAPATAGSEDAGAGEAGSEVRRTKRKKGAAVPATALEDYESPKKKVKKKQILRKDDLVDYDGDRDGWRGKKDKRAKKGADGRPGESSDGSAVVHGKKIVKVDGQITVGDLAKQMGAKLTDVMTTLMKLGVMATVNQLLDFDTVIIIAEEFGAEAVNTGQDVEDVIAALAQPDPEESMQLRSPVVTVMGHVDHGKTSLLDAIRKTSVTAGEVGGITQHIGAYTVAVPSGGFVTFLDTPGHEAFTAMRSRGAKVTDIVVLVVAADDGVMPQTAEAINHAKAAGVPIIVAINKMDKEGANPDRVKTQLNEHGLVPEDWGGDTILVPVSAHTKMNLDLLLENLHVQSEILELKANPGRSAVGTVVESKIDRGRGAVATVLVQRGTLKKGDAFICGTAFGRVRALVSDHGKAVEEAGPSTPVEVLGLSHAPEAGDDFYVLDSESTARKISEQRSRRKRLHELAGRSKQQATSLTLERFSEMVKVGNVKELPLIVKADVQGSVEAVTESLQQLSNEEVKVNVIHRGVGAISENDVQLATASRAIVIGFNVRADARAAAVAEAEGVQFLYSRIIYDLANQVSAAIRGMIDPKFEEKTIARVEVRQTFRVPKLGMVAGSYVVDGVVQRGALVRLLRDNRVIFEGKMASLRRFKDDVREVQAGYECGIGIEGYSDIHDGDVIEVYKVVEQEQPQV